MTADLLAGLVAEADAELVPATSREMAVFIERIAAYAVRYRIPVEDSAGLFDDYAEALEGVPEPYLRVVLKAFRMGWTDTFRLPTPKQIRAFLPKDYWLWRSERIKLRCALAAARSGDYEPAPDPDAPSRQDQLRLVEQMTGRRAVGDDS